MPKFSVATVLLVVALIPIGTGFAIGCDYITLISLAWIFPVEFSGNELVKLGWPSDAQDALGQYLFENPYNLYTMNLVWHAGLFLVVATCAALGSLRLRFAAITAWLLVATLPFSVAIMTYRFTGKPYILAPEYQVIGVVACFCAIAWMTARWMSKRWIYGNNPADAVRSRTQIWIYLLLAIAIFATSLYGWWILKLAEEYSAENSTHLAHPLTVCRSMRS
jgi:hypothetical protein